MSKTIWLPAMSDDQLRKNVAYVAYCMKLPADPQNDVTITIANWLDLLEGRCFAPGDGEVWSDVEQPQEVEICSAVMNGTVCGMPRPNHALWEKLHAGVSFVHEFKG